MPDRQAFDIAVDSNLEVPTAFADWVAIADRRANSLFGHNPVAHSLFAHNLLACNRLVHTLVEGHSHAVAANAHIQAQQVAVWAALQPVEPAHIEA